MFFSINEMFTKRMICSIFIKDLLNTKDIKQRVQQNTQDTKGKQRTQ